MAFLPTFVITYEAFSLNVVCMTWLTTKQLSFTQQINTDVSQKSVLAFTLFLLHIKDLFSTTAYLIHRYADDITLHSNNHFPKQPPNTIELCKPHYANISSKKSTFDLGSGAKKYSSFGTIFLDGLSLQNSDSLDVIGVPFYRDLNWHKYITSIVTSAVKKLGFFYVRKYFSPMNL